MDEKLYKVIVEACDGTHVLHKALTYDDAKKKTEEWMDRPLRTFEEDESFGIKTARAISDHGPVILIQRYLSDVTDQVWDAVSYSWKVTFEEMDTHRKDDEILQDYLKGLSDEQIKQGLKELEEAGFISPDKVV